MKSFLEKVEPYAYSILRIAAGFLFLWHGTEKLFGFPPSSGGGMPSFLQYAGGSIEFIGGLLILAGLFTSIAAFISCGEMAFAYWMFHVLGHSPYVLLPILNKGDLAVLFCFVFLFITARGPGLLSLDALIFKTKK